MRLPTHQASDIAQLLPHRWQLVSLGGTGFPAHQTTTLPYYDERAKSP
ncbi:hypothetical protein [Pseudomonas sp. G2-4]|nr:hypothetical protein [Pseudomonas sp. G2-4]WHS57717.1 hypothetical protein QNH97_14615 [Pseudomonas sp. G2-4]